MWEKGLENVFPEPQGSMEGVGKMRTRSAKKRIKWGSESTIQELV